MLQKSMIRRSIQRTVSTQTLRKFNTVRGVSRSFRTSSSSFDQEEQGVRSKVEQVKIVEPAKQEKRLFGDVKVVKSATVASTQQQQTTTVDTTAVVDTKSSLFSSKQQIGRASCRERV